MIPVNGVQLVELPITFAEDLNAILAGNNIVRYNNAQPMSALQELKSPPLLYDCTNRYIIFDLNIINAINPSMIRNVSELISSYLAPKTDTSYQVLFYQNNQYKYTNFYMAGIPNALPEQVKQITRTYGFTYLQTTHLHQHLLTILDKRGGEETSPLLKYNKQIELHKTREINCNKYKGGY